MCIRTYLLCVTLGKLIKKDENDNRDENSCEPNDVRYLCAVSLTQSHTIN